jgi:hypothetical protein
MAYKLLNPEPYHILGDVVINWAGNYFTLYHRPYSVYHFLDT